MREILIRSTFSDKLNGGEGGIRTHGPRKGTPVFETDAFSHSATSPHKGDNTLLVIIPPVYPVSYFSCGFVSIAK